MLIEFRVKNFRSFRDECRLSMVAAEDASLPDNRFSAGGFNLLRSAVIYGANASGKSNLIEAITFMQTFITESAKNQPGDEISVHPFRLDSRSESQPSEFEITFLFDGVRYEYGFAVNSTEVTNEWLFEYPSARGRKWFERNTNPEKDQRPWEFPSNNLKGKKREFAEETGKSRLFLSYAASRNHPQLTPLYEWIRNNLRLILPGMSLKPLTISLFLESDKKANSIIADLLHNADLGISGIKIAESNIEIEKEFPKDMPSEVRDVLLREWRYDVNVLHRGVDGREDVAFNLRTDESEGTRRLFELAGAWAESLLNGYVVFVDELDASLHPLLVSKLVGLFCNPKININNAQLVFVTHDTTLLTDELFRRDQIWFTEKDAGGASHLYPLSDYKPRKTEAWQKGYLAGRYGAVPILDDLVKK